MSDKKQCKYVNPNGNRCPIEAIKGEKYCDRHLIEYFEPTGCRMQLRAPFAILDALEQSIDASYQQGQHSRTHSGLHSYSEAKSRFADELLLFVDPQVNDTENLTAEAMIYRFPALLSLTTQGIHAHLLITTRSGEFWQFTHVFVPNDDIERWQAWYKPGMMPDDFINSYDAFLAKQAELDTAINNLLRPSSYLPRNYDTSSDIVAHTARCGFLDQDRWIDDLMQLRCIYPGKNRAGNVSIVLDRNEREPDDLYTFDGIDQDKAREWLTPLRETIKRFDDTHADVFDILLMKWLEECGGNPDYWAEIGVHDIISARKLKLANGSVRQEDTEKYSQALQDVIRPKVEGSVEVFIKNKRGKSEKVLLAPNTPLFTVDAELTAPKLWGRPVLLGIRYKPGIWARYLLDPYTPQLARMMRCVLEFDPYHEQKQKRFSRYFTTYFRINRGKPTTLSMNAMLEGAHIEITDANRSDPSKFIKSIEKALDDVWDKWGMGGSVKPIDTSPLPRKGVLDAWLKRRWRITPPDEIRKQYAAIPVKRQEYIEASKKALEARKARDKS